jgi:hypothetical protein
MLKGLVRRTPELEADLADMLPARANPFSTIAGAGRDPTAISFSWDVMAAY